jgi:hypothetical protein
MKRTVTIGIVRDRGLGEPPSRRALGLAVMITCAVAAVSFTLGLMR